MLRFVCLLLVVDRHHISYHLNHFQGSLPPHALPLGNVCLATGLSAMEQANLEWKALERASVNPSFLSCLSQVFVLAVEDWPAQCLNHHGSLLGEVTEQGWKSIFLSSSIAFRVCFYF